MSATTTREEYICEDYTGGMEIGELGRTYGLSERRISQILMEANIVRRPRGLTQKKPVSRVHERLGLHLYTYRQDKGIEIATAANDLNWSVIKLRKVEQGQTSVETLDLMDIAAYTSTSIKDLI